MVGTEQQERLAAQLSAATRRRFAGEIKREVKKKVDKFYRTPTGTVRSDDPDYTPPDGSWTISQAEYTGITQKVQAGATTAEAERLVTRERLSKGLAVSLSNEQIAEFNRQEAVLSVQQEALVKQAQDLRRQGFQVDIREKKIFTTDPRTGKREEFTRKRAMTELERLREVGKAEEIRQIETKKKALETLEKQEVARIEREKPFIPELTQFIERGKLKPEEAIIPIPTILGATIVPLEARREEAERILKAEGALGIERVPYKPISEIHAIETVEMPSWFVPTYEPTLEIRAAEIEVKAVKTPMERVALTALWAGITAKQIGKAVLERPGEAGLMAVGFALAPPVLAAAAFGGLFGYEILSRQEYITPEEVIGKAAFYGAMIGGSRIISKAFTKKLSGIEKSKVKPKTKLEKIKTLYKGSTGGEQIAAREAYLRIGGKLKDLPPPKIISRPKPIVTPPTPTIKPIISTKPVSTTKDIIPVKPIFEFAPAIVPLGVLQLRPPLEKVLTKAEIRATGNEALYQELIAGRIKPTTDIPSSVMKRYRQWQTAKRGMQPLYVKPTLEVPLGVLQLRPPLEKPPTILPSTKILRKRARQEMAIGLDISPKAPFVPVKELPPYSKYFAKQKRKEMGAILLTGLAARRVSFPSWKVWERLAKPTKKALPYETKLVEIGKTYPIETFGFEKGLKIKLVKEIAARIKAKLPTKPFIIIEKPIPIVKPLTTPKAPKGYIWVEPPTGGLVQLVKLKEPILKPPKLKGKIKPPVIKKQATEQILKPPTRLRTEQILKQELQLREIPKVKLVTKQGIGLILLQKQEPTQIQVQKQILLQKQAQAQLLDVAPAQAQAQLLDVAPAQAQAQAQLLDVAPAQAQLLDVEQKQKLKQITEKQITEKQITERIIDVPPPPIIIIIKPKSKTQLIKAIKIRLKEQGYDVLIKKKLEKLKKGKYKAVGYKKANVEPLTRTAALGLMASVLDTYANRSGKIKKTDKMPTKRRELEARWRMLQHKFRMAKKKPNVIVEKVKYAIDNPQEVREIPYESLRLRRAGLLVTKERARKQRAIQSLIAIKQQQASLVTTKKQSQINFFKTKQSKSSGTSKWI